MNMVSPTGWYRVVATIAVCASFANCGTKASSSSDVCGDFCPAYTACRVNAGGSGIPLFCDSAVGALCSTACTNAVDGLGSSKEVFLACESCVLRYGSTDICDSTKSDQTASVSCSDTCDSSTARSGRSKFLSDFRAAFDNAAANISGCDGQGDKIWNANDPAIGHSSGSEVGSGSWQCVGGSDCMYGYFMFGPNVTLPRGSYTAGFTGVASPQAPSGTQVGFIDVYSEATNSIATQPISGTQLTGTVSIPFTINSPMEGFQVRLGLYDNVESVTVGKVFVRRQ